MQQFHLKAWWSGNFSYVLKFWQTNSKFPKNTKESLKFSNFRPPGDFKPLKTHLEASDFGQSGLIWKFGDLEIFCMSWNVDKLSPSAPICWSSSLNVTENVCNWVKVEIEGIGQWVRMGTWTSNEMEWWSWTWGVVKVSEKANSSRSLHTLSHLIYCSKLSRAIKK